MWCSISAKTFPKKNPGRRREIRYIYFDDYLTWFTMASKA
jgi:hypothetical protein